MKISQTLSLLIATGAILLTANSYADATGCPSHKAVVNINNQTSKSMDLVYEVVPYVVTSESGSTGTMQNFAPDESQKQTHQITIDPHSKFSTSINITSDSNCYYDYATSHPNTTFTTSVQGLRVDSAKTDDNTNFFYSKSSDSCSVKGTTDNIVSYLDMFTIPQHRNISCHHS